MNNCMTINTTQFRVIKSGGGIMFENIKFFIYHNILLFALQTNCWMACISSMSFPDLRVCVNA